MADPIIRVEMAFCKRHGCRKMHQKLVYEPGVMYPMGGGYIDGDVFVVDTVDHYSAVPSCDWFWGSHGCNLPLGHDGDQHVCDPDVSEPPFTAENSCFIWQRGDKGEFQ